MNLKVGDIIIPDKSSLEYVVLDTSTSGTLILPMYKLRDLSLRRDAWLMSSDHPFELQYHLTKFLQALFNISL